MADGLGTEALSLLRRLTGNAESAFRGDQLGAIRSLVGDRSRTLLVQRTGWGKSAVYFIATKMLRDRGAGPTLLVSPLLALMRNQIEAARRMEIRAATINSANRKEWEEVQAQLADDEVDLLLISPERLANPMFRSDILPEVGRRSGLLVIDEAHCISDWGHDFRPDYRRLVRVLELLPAGVPVLCCTATANSRVVEDVVSQLGADLAPVRGPLGRDGLQLVVQHIPQQSARLALLAELVPSLPGTGIVYCLTIADTERVARWLQVNGIFAVAYSGSTNPEERETIEEALLSNRFKVVVATSALGMGFDKPDLGFVIHFQSPGSPIAYYQQVGRAGRALPRSWGILLSGSEDVDIQDHFIRSAFPDPDLADQVVSILEDRAVPISTDDILEYLNVRQGQLELLLKNLEVDGAVERDAGRWLRTLNRWSYDHERMRAVTALRRTEQGQMNQYMQTTGCRMQLLRNFLDDPVHEPCGICDNCSKAGPLLPPAPAEVQRAVEFLRSADRPIGPRKRFPDRSQIPQDRLLEVGRALAVWGDGGWGSLVRSGKHDDGRFDDQLVQAAADLIRGRWQPDPAPAWVTFVPSLRDADLVADFAGRLAELLGLPCQDVVVKVRDTAEQKTMQNSLQQYANVQDAFDVVTPVRAGAALLVDDVVDSRWTLTAIGGRLRAAGVPHVFPFALADAAGRGVS